VLLKLPFIGAVRRFARERACVPSRRHVRAGMPLFRRWSRAGRGRDLRSRRGLEQAASGVVQGAPLASALEREARSAPAPVQLLRGESRAARVADWRGTPGIFAAQERSVACAALVTALEPALIVAFEASSHFTAAPAPAVYSLRRACDAPPCAVRCAQGVTLLELLVVLTCRAVLGVTGLAFESLRRRGNLEQVVDSTSAG